jgi:hypothetical protein
MPLKMYRVVDPQHEYPIYAVEVLGIDAAEAIELALEAMMGCVLDDLDEKVVEDGLAALTVEEMPRRQED